MATALYSQEAEEAVIGAVMINPNEFIIIDLEPDDFYLGKHQWIWETYQKIAKRGQKIDILMVCDELEKANRLQEIGGMSYVMGIMNQTPMSMHCEQYADIIRDMARRRLLIQTANEIAQAAHDKNKPIDESTPRFIEQISNASRIKQGAVHIQNFVSDLYDEVQERSENPVDIWGIPTGFPRLDLLTGGQQKGELTIISGPPAAGKSMITMQIGANMGDKKPGAIFSIEMKGKQVTRRLVSGMGKIQTRNLKTGNLEDNEWAQFTQAVEILSKKQVYMSDYDGWTTTSLRAELARLKAQYKIEWFVLDYLFLLKDAGKDEIEKTMNISYALKHICRELDIAGLVVHSMNKAGIGNEVPTMDNLRGSGQVIYDADLVLFFTKFKAMTPAEKEFEKFQNEKAKNMSTLYVGKGREIESPKKYIHFEKRGDYPWFEERMIEDD